MILYDLIFWFALLALTFLFFKIFVNKFAVINALPLDQITASQDIAEKVLSDLKGFVFFLFTTSLIFFMIIFLVMSICKTLVWFSVANKKITIRDITRFIFVRFLWLLITIGAAILSTPLILLIVLSSKIQSPNLLLISLVLMFILWFFLNNIRNLVYLYYTEKKSISSIKSAFILGTKKAHKFILPYSVIIITFILFFNAYYYAFKFLFQKILPITEEPSLAVAFFYLIIPLLIFFAWFRIYLYNTFMDITKN